MSSSVKLGLGGYACDICWKMPMVLLVDVDTIRWPRASGCEKEAIVESWINGKC
jgi:hypothetical protein